MFLAFVLLFLTGIVGVYWIILRAVYTDENKSNLILIFACVSILLFSAPVLLLFDNLELAAKQMGQEVNDDITEKSKRLAKIKEQKNTQDSKNKIRELDENLLELKNKKSKTEFFYIGIRVLILFVAFILMSVAANYLTEVTLKKQRNTTELQLSANIEKKLDAVYRNQSILIFLVAILLILVVVK